MSNIIEIKPREINQIHGGDNKYTKKLEEMGGNFGECIGGYLDTASDIMKAYPVNTAVAVGVLLLCYVTFKNIQTFRSGKRLGGNDTGKSRLLG